MSTGTTSEATVTEEKVATKEVAGTELNETLGENSEKIDSLGVKATDSFVYMDEVKAILDVAMKTEKNVILYGPGGYGKSEFTLEYLKEAGIEDPYVITMGTGMTTDRMFGGLNIPVFNATGKIEYLVENSFMNSEFVIFEELFDAPDFILEQLKDILSSGVFRNGSQQFEIKTRVIICCTNKTREEFSKNNSLKALMERFPLEMKVVWKDHNRITYENLLKSRMGGADPMLTYILERFAVGGKTISPRIAITAAEIVMQCGPAALKCVADFAAKPDLLKDSIAKFESVKLINDEMMKIKEIVDKYSAIDLSTLPGVKAAQAENKKLFTAITTLKAIKADDSVAASTATAVKNFTETYNANKAKIDKILLGEE